MYYYAYSLVQNKKEKNTFADRFFFAGAMIRMTAFKVGS